MRLTRIAAADLRRDPARAARCGQGAGLLPRPARAFVEEARDGLPDHRRRAGRLAPGDAQIIVTAARLTAKSALRKLFEGAKNAYAAAIYDDPPGRAEIEARCWRRRAARRSPRRDGRRSRRWRARSIPAISARRSRSWRSTSSAMTTPLSPADIAAVAPATTEAELDDMLQRRGRGRGPGRSARCCSRSKAQGVAARRALHRRHAPFPRAACRRLSPERARRRASGAAPAGLRPAPRPDDAAGAALGHADGWNRRWAC